MNGQVHTLVGVHAMYAVSAQERRLFENHLPFCPTCALDAHELAATAALLGVAAWADPPAEMRERVIGAISRTRQERYIFALLSRYVARVRSA